jgi:hypothetical protein
MSMLASHFGESLACNSMRTKARDNTARNVARALASAYH